MNLDVWSEIETAIRTNLATIWAHRNPDGATVRAIAAKYRVDSRDVMHMALAAKSRGEFPRPGAEPPAVRLAKARVLADAAKAKAAAEAAPPVVIDQPEHECWECGHVATRRNSLHMHGQRHGHRIDPAPADPLACPHCNYRAKVPRGLAIHIGRDHKPAAPHPVPGVTETPGDDVAPEETETPAAAAAVEDEPSPPPATQDQSAEVPDEPSAVAEAAEPMDHLADPPGGHSLGWYLDRAAGYLNHEDPAVVEAAEDAVRAARILGDTVTAYEQQTQLRDERARLLARIAEIDAALAPVTDGQDEEAAA